MKTTKGLQTCQRESETKHSELQTKSQTQNEHKYTKYLTGPPTKATTSRQTTNQKMKFKRVVKLRRTGGRTMGQACVVDVGLETEARIGGGRARN